MMRALPLSAPDWKHLSSSLSGWRQSLPGMLACSGRALADAHPRLYLLVATVCALAGYLWLLLFPWLAVLSGAGIWRALAGAQGVAWLAALAWLVTGALATLVSYRLYRFRPAPPAGELLDSATHPQLFRLIEEQTGHFRTGRIDRVILSGDFDVLLLKTPRLPVPVWSTNTLVLGVPLLRTVSELQFRCLLARRLGQFSKRYHPVQNWLYQLRAIWPQYRDLTGTGGAGFQPVAWFFRVYAPAYALLTEAVACMDELSADSYAMELFTDEEVLDAIVTEAVCRHYLAAKYWPVVRKYAARNHRVQDRLHNGMPTVLRAGLQADTVEHWVGRTLSSGESCEGGTPSLASRVDNIGFGHARMSALSEPAAAAVWLAGR